MSECKLELAAEIADNVLNVSFEHLGIATFDCNPSVFHLVPEPFNSIQFWTVRRKKVQRQAFRREIFDYWLVSFRLVDRGVVKNNHDGLAKMSQGLS